MKLRFGYVSNSSSQSFHILGIKTKRKDNSGYNTIDQWFDYDLKKMEENARENFAENGKHCCCQEFDDSKYRQCDSDNDKFLYLAKLQKNPKYDNDYSFGLLDVVEISENEVIIGFNWDRWLKDETFTDFMNKVQDALESVGFNGMIDEDNEYEKKDEEGY